MQKKFNFVVDELETEPEPFTVLQHTEKDVYQIIEEAARKFYFGRAGFEEGWPLTFTLLNSNNLFIATAHVFILSAIPTFDVILA